MRTVQTGQAGRVALAALWGLVASAAGGEVVTLKAWEFDAPNGLAGWTAGGHLADVRVADGVLSAGVIDWDPILVSPAFDIPARHSQWVELRIRSRTGGRGEVFWTNTLKTKYGGFSPGRQTAFELRGDGGWHVYRVRCGWEPLGRIIKIRVDLPGTRGRQTPPPAYELDYVRILDARSSSARQARPDWSFARGPAGWSVEGPSGAAAATGGQLAWTSAGDAGALLAPPVDFDAAARALLSVRMSVSAGRTATLGFATAEAAGLQQVTFPIRGDGRLRWYLADLGAAPAWRGRVRLLTLRPSDEGAATARISAIRLAPRPAGEAQLEASAFGLADALARAGQDLRVSVSLRNTGAGIARGVWCTLAAPDGLAVRAPARQVLGNLYPGEHRLVSWPVRAEKALAGPARLTAGFGQAAEPALRARAQLRVEPGLNLPRADYVPPPKPVETDDQVGVYYFPGWASINRWRPIFDYPERKPALGWYDESLPEVADWQIKWAVEHGVSFFAVDWYWCRGSRQLEHWLHRAYFHARYRTYLKFCLLWANHNAPGSHDEADWLAVTDYWIRHYFRRPEYLKIDGKPVVVIFDVHRPVRDMGAAAMARAVAGAKRRCRDAGLGGLYLVACTRADRAAHGRLKAQGYDAASGYNYADLGAAGRRWAPYADLLAPHAKLWRDAAALGMLRQIPALSGGWDSRPWHKASARVRQGRTPALFEKHCRDAKAFLDRPDRRPAGSRGVCLIEAWNEWGEGSYVGPHREYGFGYLEAVRRVFAPRSKPPLLVGPRDVGLGPYDLPGAGEAAPTQATWDFTRPADRRAWSAGARQASIAPAAQQLEGVSTGTDAALSGPAVRLETDRLGCLRVDVRVDRDDTMQLFWSTTTRGVSEADSVRIRLRGDGRMHTYWVDLSANPRWAGLVTGLRLDPVAGAGVRFAIARLGFHERKKGTGQANPSLAPSAHLRPSRGR